MKEMVGKKEGKCRISLKEKKTVNTVCHEPNHGRRWRLENIYVQRNQRSPGSIMG